MGDLETLQKWEEAESSFKGGKTSGRAEHFRWREFGQTRRTGGQRKREEEVLWRPPNIQEKEEGDTGDGKWKRGVRS